MRHLDFTPFYRSTVGFDRLFDLLDSASGFEALFHTSIVSGATTSAFAFGEPSALVSPSSGCAVPQLASWAWTSHTDCCTCR